jgi:tetratricopeptide (TPR) repeat protein
VRGDRACLDRRRALLADATRAVGESGDDVALCDVLLAQVNALWEPSGAADRLTAAERAIAAARRARDLDRELAARLARIDALVEVGRLGDAELEVATYGRLVRPLDRPELEAFAASRRASMAMAVGRLDDMIRLGEDAYRAAVAAGLPDSERLRMVYRGTLARERAGADMDADVAETAAMFSRMATRMPGHYFEADAAAALAILGRPDEARAELARAMPSLLTSFGYRWLFACCDAAEAAAVVGGHTDCERLYAALQPHADTFVVLGPAFWGAVSHRLGALAIRLGRTEQAVEQLSRAVRDLDAIAALSWAARARIDLARALELAGDRDGATRERTSARDTMRALGMTRGLAELDAMPTAPMESTWSLVRDGDGWLLEAGPEQARVRGRGVEHLRTLLANPAQDVAALDLDAADGAPPAVAGLDVLDDQAIAAYRRRLGEIELELVVADRRGDAHVAASLEDERDRLLAELRSATGLGGRRRRTNDTAERARVNVTRSLKRAIEQISREAPLAGAHLARSVRTGSACRYDPAPGGPDRWRV